jgi:hypothetical protein
MATALWRVSGDRVNDHPHSGRLGYSATALKDKRTSLLRRMHSQPGEKHTVCSARINVRKEGWKTWYPMAMGFFL